MNRFFWAVVVPVAASALAAALSLTASLVPASVPAQTGLFLSRYQSECAPEPREQLCYLLAITIVPLVFWLGAIYNRRRGGTKTCGLAPAVAAKTSRCSMFGRRLSLIFRKLRATWPGIVCWIFTILVAGMLVYQETMLEPYIGLSTLGTAFVVVILSGLLWRPLARACKRWQSWRQEAVSQDGSVHRWHHAIPALVAVVVTVLELLPGIYLQDMRDVGFVYGAHTPVQMGEFAAVLGGRTPFVDFMPQYQTALSYVLAPVFQHTGLTITTFSLAMCVLSLLGLLTIYFIFLRVTGSSWQALLLYLPFLFVSFVPLNDAGLAHHQRFNAFNYYAIWPLRYLGPSITAGVLAWYLTSAGRIRQFVLFLVAGLGALNNIDFGIPALGGVLIAVLFTTGDGPLPHWRMIGQVLLSFALAVALAVLGFILLTYARSGQLPDFAMLTFYQRVFLLNGFNMLPMPPLGLHVVFYLTFMGAIARALFSAPQHRLTNGLLLYFGVFGCGALMYYVGRSHHVVLIGVFAAWACAFLLLAYVLCNAFVGQAFQPDLGRVRQAGKPDLQKKEPAAACRVLHARGLLIGLGFLLCLFQLSTFPNPVHQIARLRSRKARSWPDTAPLVQFVRQHVGPREKVIIACPYGHLIAYEANVINVFPFVQGESLILRSQVDRVMEAIEQSAVARVFGAFEPELAQALAQHGFQPTARLNAFALWEQAVSSFSEDIPSP